MRRSHGHHKITVEALLQLKRTERPPEDFWDRFEQDFHRRRLNALVKKGGLRDMLWNPFVKALALGSPALLLAGLALFWSRSEYAGQPELPDVKPVALQLPAAVAVVETDQREAGIAADSVPELNTGMAASQFVMDAIHPNAGPSVNFRKVMYTPAIRLSSPSGASYVKDSLSSQIYQVTTADLKLGRNF